MPKEIKNVGASVRARLQNLSRETGQTFELVLTRYALERLLYRLGTSVHVDRFVLKGAMLLTSWFMDPHRATRDLDLLGCGDPSPDAMVDVSFGDALEPGVEVIDYPCMLDLPAPRLGAYARETVIGEKFQAMVALGRANSRMKDFYDIWLLSQSFPFDDDRLASAIAATFERRETEIPAELPDALTPAFAEDEQKQRQWNAFLENVALRPGSLADVITSVARFIMPHAIAAAKTGRSY